MYLLYLMMPTKPAVVFLLATGLCWAEMTSRMTLPQPFDSAWRRCWSRWNVDFTFKGVNCPCCFSRAEQFTRGSVTTTERRTIGNSGALIRYIHLCHTHTSGHDTSTQGQSSNFTNTPELTHATSHYIVPHTVEVLTIHQCCVVCILLWLVVVVVVK